MYIGIAVETYGARDARKAGNMTQYTTIEFSATQAQVDVIELVLQQNGINYVGNETADGSCVWEFDIPMLNFQSVSALIVRNGGALRMEGH